MPILFRWLSKEFATSAQVSPADMAEVAAQGFRTVINNRPDGEGGPDQPTDARIGEAARAAGLHYVYLPVIPGRVTPGQVAEMAQALKDSPGPVFGFCRSGSRTEALFRMASSPAH